MGLSFSKIASYFPRKQEVRILLLGLDAAGKTTALYAMKLGELVTTIPTIGFNVEKVEYKNITITTWDVGGRDKIRPLWQHYYQKAHAIVFVVDSNDRDRISEASQELHKMVNDDDLRNKPVLILANKQDLPNAMSIDELHDKLALNKLTGDRKWHIQATVATTNQGLQEGFEWLANASVTKNVNILQPLIETANDSKVMKDDILSMVHSINLKSILAKLTQY
ncbi:unnamed protein product [Rotaria sordida]|uniref:ADP-ribosylation factor n=2 Tax=Rotaria sordida TaxID=392033 RepID=A0A815B545_9BILA|nr:unnamed protein product [Rotaria sordida]CAF1067226.1 unnamed protein product [Rotaria sordida]CAF1265969.1 unnamed protein product [Rotaria sordida]CAF1474749.1 unnamed protein product [Rotaria sordida]CAF3758586.1 unnamed protein product [Rotaria sordida]